MTHFSRTEESVPQMLINLLMMLLLATTQFFEGRQNDWTTRMDYLRKIQVISQLENSSGTSPCRNTAHCTPEVA